MAFRSGVWYVLWAVINRADLVIVPKYCLRMQWAGTGDPQKFDQVEFETRHCPISVALKLLISRSQIFVVFQERHVAQICR